MLLSRMLIHERDLSKIRLKLQGTTSALQLQLALWLATTP